MPEITTRWRTFASFAVRNYRFFFVGALVSNLGTWIQRIGQDWLVLTELTDNSSTALGIVTALQFLAIPLLAPYAGAVVDRFDKRKVLVISQLALAATALALWGLVATGTVQLWHVYVFALITGAITAFDNPARQSFVSEMVPLKLLPNAVGLNSTSFNGARLIGPGLAGVLVAAVGVGPTLLINGLSFFAFIAALLLMRADELHPAPMVKARGAAMDGLRYLGGRPDIIVLLVVVFMLGTFGMNFQIFNATMATEVFRAGAREFGLLGTIMAIGTLAGALGATRRANPSLRTVLMALTGFAVSTFALTFAPNYTVYALLLIPSGFFALTVMTTANAAVQLSTAPEYRGRVMAVYVAIFAGGTPLGAPLIGWLGEVLGPRASVLVASLATGMAVIGVLAWFMVHDGLRLHIERGRPLRIRATLPSRPAYGGAR
ncbi:MFS transporter [Tessaracoccus sp. MC1865]|uniref:MFS transporter n=1 Tax=Tessaracoccus sp. MC1865 TaxID=2760310 RepID=UPI0015FED84F|nr:MFS transporter [Tessaracoccus sp. MC1865]MBB1482924.1 MFS transporter [Tessaracoccus sp. MC1865]QTO37637.1 MFS transporter [Tessaracoccus sp. MC1865]